ncbi:MAG: hypothetical protein M5R41_05165 [Bacteroidia bacterium]|nr:hypothetical protein [Bacteroidia bacterium]
MARRIKQVVKDTSPPTQRTDPKAQEPSMSNDTIIDLATATPADAFVKEIMSNVEPVQVSLTKTDTPVTSDQALWVMIKNRTAAVGFKKFDEFMHNVLCELEMKRNTEDAAEYLKKIADQTKPLKVTNYGLVKVAAELFLKQECGELVKSFDDQHQTAEESDRMVKRRAFRGVSVEVLAEAKEKYLHKISEQSRGYTLPYLSSIINALKGIPLKQAGEVSSCYGILETQLTNPCMLELIWSYWHEEGMLVQSVNAISRRFQNVRAGSSRDPLAHLEMDPLRPLNNILWDYIQDEQHRLTILRRAYEYDHQYGLRLEGRAVPPLRSADSRSKFLESFHNLLNRCAAFFKQDDNTTVISDGFPVLNALKETHLILTEGGHNQYGDLPWTARVEMLIQQWMLARPEIKTFLPGRTMVAYPEEWMRQVDSIKKLYGWSDTPVMHYRDLGVFGEQLLLGIRFGNWNDISEADSAKNWVRFWRNEIQGYIHAYRAVTGVDLTNSAVNANITSSAVNATLPSILIRERMKQQKVL